ncbi:MAG: CubicO group peptidase (beta-lactamase class C family) [Candidatus Azotimanducaceae bacterium]|jgi:CubicO group peptidase (beta-lactamase class C family)
MIKITQLFLLVLITSPTLAGTLPKSKPSSVGMSADRLARIAPAMQSYIDQDLVAGTVTLIARKGKIVHFEAQGYMDAENKVPMRKDAIFRIASMTKPVTSVALMMLWEQGRFQLRDPVSKFLPEFKDQMVSTTGDVSGGTGELVPVEREATIRDMLTHTAGLANPYVGNGEAYRAIARVRPEDDLESLIKRLAAAPLNYHPGEAWQYSQATDVVGRLVEVISGVQLDQYMQDKIFTPLNMTDTSFYLNDTRGNRLTTQYKPGLDNKIQLQDPGSNRSRWISGENKKVFRGAGGLVSTASDYIKFQQMILSEGILNGKRLLAPATISLMLENHTGDLPLWLAGPGMGFGLGYGIVIDRGAAATPLSLGSGYWGGAYCTISWVDPEQELTAVMMTQVRPYGHLNIRQDFQVLTYQAIVD